jgi:hypothetical protein
MAAASPAHARTLRLAVVIDASGSMVITRSNTDGKGATRFAAAKVLAREKIFELAQAIVDGDDLLVSVDTFRGAATANHHTAGFVDPEVAAIAIDGLTIELNVGGSTPLGGAVCAAADALATTDADVQSLYLASDGEENSTPPGHPCQGSVFRGTVTAVSDYPEESYQAKVIRRIRTTSPAVIVTVDLFQPQNVTLAAPLGSLELEGVAPAAAGSLPVPAVAALDPLEQFFTLLTETTGGQLTVARDDQALPISGDLNSDRCVDRNDAILVARGFGPIVAPVGIRLDLNLDRAIDFADYLIQLARITPSCGPDSYAPRAPVVCTGPGQIVIDGKSVESGGITIDVRSACQIVIRNSLIVSGQNAIRIDGSAVVRVDNSIIVGQNALIGTRGTIILSAANSVFHGPLTINGALNFINRGGNIFE